MTNTELREWRASQNMTRKQLGELFNTPTETIKNWEARPELSGHRRIPGIVPAFIGLYDSVLNPSQEIIGAGTIADENNNSNNVECVWDTMVSAILEEQWNI